MSHELVKSYTPPRDPPLKSGTPPWVRVPGHHTTADRGARPPQPYHYAAGAGLGLERDLIVHITSGRRDRHIHILGKRCQERIFSATGWAW